MKIKSLDSWCYRLSCLAFIIFDAKSVTAADKIWVHGFKICLKILLLAHYLLHGLHQKLENGTCINIPGL